MDPDTRTARRRDGAYNRGNRAPSDLDLVTAFQLEASVGIIDGPAWRAVRDHVWMYAIRTLRSVITKGTVWGLYHRLGGTPSVDLRMPARGVHHEDAYDLAAETVERALSVLRQQLIANRWRPAGGASLQTWTVNLCILRLPTAWRAWRRTHVSRLPERFERAPDNPAYRPDAVIYTIEYERQLELLDDDLLEAILKLDCIGMSDKEIAVLVDRTVKSVEYQLLKGRTLIRLRAQRERRLDRRMDGVA